LKGQKMSTQAEEGPKRGKDAQNQERREKRQSKEVRVKRKSKESTG